MSKHGPDEHKSTQFFVKAVDDAIGIVTLIGNVFGIVDDGDDLLENGCCAKTLTERGNRLKFLDQHRTDSISRVIAKVIGCREVGKADLPVEVLELYPEATGGIEMTVQCLMNTPEGKGAFERISVGAVDEYSIGFDIIKQEYRKLIWRGVEKVIRVIKEIKLWEISAVIWGMNPATATVGTKEMTPDGPVKRLGDYIAGKIMQTVNSCIDPMFTNGEMTREEHATCRGAMDSAINAFVGGMPDDLSLRPVQSYGSFFDLFWALNNDPELKAGRRLSAATVAQIDAIIASLQQLRDGGETADNEADAKASDRTSTASSDKGHVPGAEPEKPPLTSTLAALLDLEQIELDLALEG